MSQGREKIHDFGNGVTLKVDGAPSQEAPHVHICQGRFSVQFFFLSGETNGNHFKKKNLEEYIEWILENEDHVKGKWEKYHGRINQSGTDEEVSE